MTDAGALYTALGAVFIALLSLIQSWIKDRKTANNVVQIKEQVKNDHGTNLRHDIDTIMAHVGYVDAKVEQLDTKVELLHTGWQRNRTDIDSLMDTEQRKTAERQVWNRPLITGKQIPKKEN